MSLGEDKKRKKEKKVFDQGALFLDPSTRDPLRYLIFLNSVPKVTNAMKREDYFLCFFGESQI